MKQNIDIINKLNEAKILDFQAGKDAERNKGLEKLDPNIGVDSLSINQALNAIIDDAVAAVKCIDGSKTYNKTYLADLMSLKSELDLLYKDMFKEE